MDQIAFSRPLQLLPAGNNRPPFNAGAGEGPAPGASRADQQVDGAGAGRGWRALLDAFPDEGSPVSH